MTNNKIGAFDADMALIGTYFYQTGETPWIETTAPDLSSRLASDNPPEFRTVLSIVGPYRDETPDSPLPRLGPLHFDFDSGDIGEAIDAFHSFLGKLEELGLDLNACRLFASGGKGFHIEIPMGCFAVEVPVEGVPRLPLVYREIAYDLIVDCLDVRIYSMKRGRMWRVPNRQRSNGAFKVPLTVGEALNITVESYADLVSAPRPFPPLAAPTFCASLAALYSKAGAKAGAKAVRKGRKAGAVSSALMARFNGSLPPSLAALGQGRFPAREGVGWNRIALQLALAAQAIGMNEDQTVSAFAGLIRDHESDGNRYNSPRKREDELRRMFDYVADSPSYEFSVAGLRSLFPVGMRVNDFRAL